MHRHVRRDWHPLCQLWGQSEWLCLAATPGQSGATRPHLPPSLLAALPGSDAAQGAPAPESWGELGRAKGPGCPQSRSPQGKCWFALGFPENKRGQLRGFPSGPAVTTSPSSVRGAGLNPGREAKIPHASWPKTQNMKQKQYWKKFNEVFRNGSH